MPLRGVRPTSTELKQVADAATRFDQVARRLQALPQGLAVGLGRVVGPVVNLDPKSEGNDHAQPDAVQADTRKTTLVMERSAQVLPSLPDYILAVDPHALSVSNWSSVPRMNGSPRKLGPLSCFVMQSST